MIDLLELRTAIQSHFLSLTANGVYFLKAPDTAVYPYLVYDISTFVDGESQDNIDLTVDFWDDETDTTVLENFVKTINAGTNRAIINTDDLIMQLFLDNQLALDDVEPDINRRQYTYSTRFFSKE